MNKFTSLEMKQAAEELSEAIKNWKLIDSRGEFLVFRLPSTPTNVKSTDEGEQMPFWRFDTRNGAERFRNRKIIAEIATLTQAAAA